MSWKCSKCNQVNADWAQQCGRCGHFTFVAFDIDDEFEKFMRKANPRIPETSAQYKESRRVFMSGCAAMFLFCSFELTKLPDEDAFKELERLKAQLEDFFLKRVGFSD